MSLARVQCSLGMFKEPENGLEERETACWQTAATSAAKKGIRRAFRQDEAAKAPKTTTKSQAVSRKKVAAI